MLKKLSVLLITLCMVIALFPAMALASQDITSTGFDYSFSWPSMITTYTAGSGTVIWDPTVTPATLTFDGATISTEITGNGAIILPSMVDGVNVVFKGTNSITALSTSFATVFHCAGETTFTLSPDSHTTLNAGNSLSYYAIGIRCASPNLSHPLTIIGSGELDIIAVGDSESSSYAIDAHTYNRYSVFLNGGVYDFNSSGGVTGNVTLGGVTIQQGTDLVLSQADSVTKGETGAVVNGELHLSDEISTEMMNSLDLTGSGVVARGELVYLYIDDEWLISRSEPLSDGFNFSAGIPGEKTAYVAGSGTIVWEPRISGDPGSLVGGTITLNDAEVEIGGYSSTDKFFQLPGVPITIMLKGTNTFTTSDGSTGTVPNTATFFYSNNSIELTGTGSIDSITTGYVIQSVTGNVKLNDGMFSGKIKANTVDLLDAIISENDILDLSEVTGAVTATNSMNAGTLVLKSSADAAAIVALNLLGNGTVIVGTDDPTYYHNDGTVIVNVIAVNPATVSVEKGGRQTFYATVTGPNNPAQTVNWSVDGNNSPNTTIDYNGVLNIASDETALTLVIKATSTESDVVGTASVWVITVYDFTEGLNGGWTKGDTNGLSFTVDVNFDDFVIVGVDGSLLADSNYTATEGSTIITLKPSYLQSLSVGEHELVIAFTNGYAITAFTIEGAPIPITGEDSYTLLWLGIALLAGAGIVTSLLLLKRKRQNG